MLRPEIWTRPAGVDVPSGLVAGEPGSRFVVETLWAERGVKSLLEGASVPAVLPPGASPAASSHSQWRSRTALITAKANVRPPGQRYGSAPKETRDEKVGCGERRTGGEAFGPRRWMM